MGHVRYRSCGNRTPSGGVRSTFLELLVCIAAVQSRGIHAAHVLLVWIVHGRRVERRELHGPKVRFCVTVASLQHFLAWQPISCHFRSQPFGRRYVVDHRGRSGLIQGPNVRHVRSGACALLKCCSLGSPEMLFLSTPAKLKQILLSLHRSLFKLATVHPAAEQVVQSCLRPGGKATNLSAHAYEESLQTRKNRGFVTKPHFTTDEGHFWPRGTSDVPLLSQKRRRMAWSLGRGSTRKERTARWSAHGLAAVERPKHLLSHVDLSSCCPRVSERFCAAPAPTRPPSPHA